MPHITFVHGIANKPEENKLKKIWLDALSSDLFNNGDGIELGAVGVTASMIYWADVRYDRPEETLQESVSNFESVEEVADKSVADPDMSWQEDLKGKEKELTDSLAAKLSFDVLVNDDFKPSEQDVFRTLNVFHCLGSSNDG